MTVNELIAMLKNLQKSVGDKHVSISVNGRLALSIIAHYDHEWDDIIIEHLPGIITAMRTKRYDGI